MADYQACNRIPHAYRVSDDGCCDKSRTLAHSSAAQSEVEAIGITERPLDRIPQEGVRRIGAIKIDVEFLSPCFDWRFGASACEYRTGRR
jgi:hypothetical protein